MTGKTRSFGAVWSEPSTGVSWALYLRLWMGLGEILLSGASWGILCRKDLPKLLCQLHHGPSPEGRDFGCWIRKSKYNTNNATGRLARRKLGQAVGRRRDSSERTRAAACKKQNSHSKAAFCFKMTVSSQRLQFWDRNYPKGNYFVWIRDAPPSLHLPPPASSVSLCPSVWHRSEVSVVWHGGRRDLPPTSPGAGLVS